MAAKIVVLGAGYAGLMAAKLVAKRAGAQVTLVNAGTRFVERVRLHQLASGQPMRDLPLADLLAGTRIQLVVDRVTRIDAQRREVELAAGEPIGYDVLVYALGSRADLGAVPGAAEHAHAVAGGEDAVRLRDRLRDSQVVAVAGGGLTGLEAATELAETHPHLKVRLVTGGKLGAALSERGRRHVWNTFTRLGIEVRDEVRIAEVGKDGLVLGDGEHVAADTVVWTTGFQVSPLAREAGLAVEDNGRLVVDETLRSVSHPEIYGIGDAAAARRPDGQELRMACATGIPAAVYASKAITDRLAGRTPKPLEFRFFNQCISLGRRDGLIQFVRADDSPVEKVLTGRLAAVYKEAVVRSTILGARRPGLVAAVA
ncbi:NAD(P)/FAD-dependent oxidoreductase [Amycolatopsis sp. 195334CR]|uniref:NAD(P)/FAD-dependent oxidoreductase n=1 Tax=Amycolatopsis sp. 195334CR TaxID=2814588 RepID=UPI001A8CB911|nr:FAD-dependent oxidoreductase [Amycolatopsis sp. 195334CR]MBN6039214.1 FAD-dependent oxidoreductase [Amycolatopsis sp. 195334CR]